MGGITFGIKLIAALKETVVAHRFGAGDHLDSFLIAYLLPLFAINVASGLFSAALVPQPIFRSESKKGNRQRNNFSQASWSLAWRC